MNIKKLDLVEFRNYENLSISFSTGVNILYGDNAQGKTNILEAIYMCSTTKSQKGSKEKEMIRFQKEEAHLRILIEKNEIERKIDMHLKRNKPKGVALDGIPVKKSSELYGIVNIVSFSPEDLYIIKNGPSDRRRFLDMELCQLDKVYLYHLMNYNKAVNQRNNLLRQIQFQSALEETLDLWDFQLVKYGCYLIHARKKFLLDLNEIIEEIHAKLSMSKEKLFMLYVPDVDEALFIESLKQSRKRDLQLKTTNKGPHRDDIIFTINGENIRRFGSQGQQRTTALSLKLAEINLVRKKISDTPILLLDDVLSELDRNRQLNLLNNIEDTQTVLTCTGLEELVNHRISIDKIFKIKDGTATAQKIQEI